MFDVNTEVPEADNEQGYETLSFTGQRNKIKPAGAGIVMGVICGIFGGIRSQVGGVSKTASIIGAVGGAISGYLVGTCTEALEKDGLSGKVLSAAIAGRMALSLGNAIARSADNVGRTNGL